MSFLGPRAARRPRLSRAFDAVRRAAARRSALSDARSIVPEAMTSLPGSNDTWSIERASQGGGGISAFVVRTSNAERLMVKVARTDAGRASLERAAAAQRAVGAMDALEGWRGLLPQVRSDGHVAAWRFVIETALDGGPLALPAPPDPAWPGASSAALAAIDGLHRATASSGPATDRASRWVDGRVAAVIALGPAIARRDPAMARGLVTALERLAPEIRTAVGDPDLPAGWVHGDYWSANILVDAAGAVSGIVDWDSAEPDELAAHDVFHLILYARKLRRHEALGAVVTDVLGRGPMDPAESEVLERASPPSLGVRTTAMLYWLRFVEANLRRQPGLATSDRWLASNVGAVAPWL